MIKKLFAGTMGLIINIAIYAIVILFAIRIVTYAYDFSYTVFGDVVMSEDVEETVTVQIPDGSSTNEIADLLERKGLIKYKNAFVVHVALSQYRGLLQAGEYELSPSMTMDEMLEILAGTAASE